MSVVYIGLGSNLGKRGKMLQQAVECLTQLPKTQVVATSSVYESPPIDMSEQNHFLNAVCKITTELSPKTLLNALKEIERKLGRPERYARWSPRPIDLDILFYDNQVLNQDGLIIPHSEIPNRKFVLLPMLELDDYLHPVLKKHLSTLLAETNDVSVVLKTKISIAIQQEN
ncbi:MAG: 2-amino-4-hydroxy-6-hydroxymethyldihydropteridine diphosphokinase [Chloroherpetonaceae bacterium]